MQCFAPYAPQADVVNCLTAQLVKGESRNMLVESARIARGDVRPLSEFNAKEFDAIILPGGFGAAKNLCNFAMQGAKATVMPEIAKVLTDMHEAKKPIGAICIAPALVALTFKGKNFELTVGERNEASQEIEKLGHKIFETQPDEIHVDRQNRVVSTAAYMYHEAPLHQIFTGIEKTVREVCSLAGV